MNGYKVVEKKIWNIVSMLTSGVLTSLIYGLLSGSSYRLKIEGQNYEVASTGMNLWCALVLVIVTFLSLWALISTLIPWLIRIRKRFAYDKIKKITAKNLISVLDETKDSIRKLYLIFSPENAKNEHLLRLHSRELAKTILRLHGTFLPQNRQLRKTIEKYFRQYEYSTIITIDQKVSGYELAAAVALLRYMLRQLQLAAGSDVLLIKDCANMKDALNDLEQLYLHKNNQKQNEDD